MFIGLHGPQEVGKDTIGKYIHDHYGFIQRSFAEPVYQCLEVLNPWICTCPEGERISSISQFVRLMDIVDDIGWDAAKKRYPAVRRWLQQFATEACRDVVDASIWVNTAQQRIQPYKARGSKDFVFTDLRFWNEAQWIKDGDSIPRYKLGTGKTVTIVRDGFSMKPEQHRPSEAGLDDWEFDYVLVSTNNLDDVPKLVDEMMEEFGVERVG